MNSVDWTSRDDYGATLITGVTDAMRRHRQAFIDHRSWAHQRMNYARAHDRATDQKAIAKILTRYTRQLMVIIKHNEGAGSQL